MNNPTFAIIDVETSGGNVNTCRVIEIGLLVHNGKRVIETYSSLVNPEKKIDPFVCALTGIFDHMVEDAPLFSEIADELIRLTEGRVFVGHNVRFDYGVIRNEFLEGFFLGLVPSDLDDISRVFLPPCFVLLSEVPCEWQLL